MTVGGKQAIFEAMSAVLNEGDEVILPVPYWVTFLEIIKYEGGKPVLLETRRARISPCTPRAIEKLITPKTRLIIVNSPHNPTGAVVPPGEMEKILALAVRHNLLLISDECYCHFVYDGRKPFSLGCLERTRAPADCRSLFQNVCYDRVAGGICAGSGQTVGQHAEAAEPLDLEPQFHCPEGRAGGHRGAAGTSARDAGASTAAGGTASWRDCSHTRRPLRSSARRLLRLSECRLLP